MTSHTNNTTCNIAPFRPPTASAALVVQLETSSHAHNEWSGADVLSNCTNSTHFHGLFLYGNETAKLIPRHLTVDDYCWQYGIVGACNANDTQYKCFMDAMTAHGVNGSEHSWCFDKQEVHEPAKGEGYKGGIKGWVVFGLAVVAVLGGM